jgi:Domain of unknown function (DUF4383)
MHTMAHTPINHPLRPLYRVLSGLIGLYMVLFGIIGYARTNNLSFFDRHGDFVLGLHTNPAFSLLSIIGGAAIVLAAVIGRNVFPYVNMVAGVIFIGVGIIMLLLLRTSANVLAFSIATVNASFAFGLVALLSGMYGKVGSTDQADAEQVLRTGHV